jgi:hypothetical protein
MRSFAGSRISTKVSYVPPVNDNSKKVAARTAASSKGHQLGLGRLHTTTRDWLLRVIGLEEIEGRPDLRFKVMEDRGDGRSEWWG